MLYPDSRYGTQTILGARNKPQEQGNTMAMLPCYVLFIPGHFVLLLLLSRFSRVRLCVTRDGSPPGSPVPGILQARTLEWVAISFSIAWKWKVKVKSLSRDRLEATPWTIAHQAPPSMGFSRQEYWSGLPLPSPHFVLRTVQFLATVQNAKPLQFLKSDVEGGYTNLICLFYSF